MEGDGDLLEKSCQVEADDTVTADDSVATDDTVTANDSVAADDTVAYHTADEDNSKYFSMISDSSDLDPGGQLDTTLNDSNVLDELKSAHLAEVVSKTDESQPALTDTSTTEASTEENHAAVDIEETKPINVLDVLSNVNTSETSDKIDDSNAATGGINVFDDDNENSVDEHNLVIDDDAVPTDRPDDIEEETDQDRISKCDFEQSQINKLSTSEETIKESSNGTNPIIETEKLNETPPEGIKDYEESEEKIDNYSALLQGALPEGSSEVVLQIDGKNVEAIHIGDGVYIYKNNDGELTAMQVIVGDDGVPNIKALHVGKNEDGNLEVYEEQINQVAVTKEELEAMKQQEQINTLETPQTEEKISQEILTETETSIQITNNEQPKEKLSVEQSKDNLMNEPLTENLLVEEPITSKSPGQVESSNLVCVKSPNANICDESDKLISVNIEAVELTPISIENKKEDTEPLTSIDDVLPSSDTQETCNDETKQTDLVEEKSVLVINSLTNLETLSDDGCKELDDTVDDNRLQIVEDDISETTNDTEDIPRQPTTDGEEVAEVDELIVDEKENNTSHISEDHNIISLQLNDAEKIQIVNESSEQNSTNLIVDKEILGMGVEIREDGIALLSSLENVNNENHKFVTLLENDGIVTLSIKNDDFITEGNELLSKMEENLQNEMALNNTNKTIIVDNYNLSIGDKHYETGVTKGFENCFESQSSVESDDDDVVEGEPVTGDSEVGWMNSLQNVHNDVHKETQEIFSRSSVMNNKGKLDVTVRNSDIANPVIMEVDFDKFVRRNSLQLIDDSLEATEDKGKTNNFRNFYRSSEDKDAYIDGDAPAVKAVSNFSLNKLPTAESVVSVPYEATTLENESENMFSNRFYNSNHVQPKTYLQRRVQHPKNMTANSILTNMNLNNSKVDKFASSAEKETAPRESPYGEPNRSASVSSTNTSRLKTYPAPQRSKAFVTYEKNRPYNPSTKMLENHMLYNISADHSESNFINLSPIKNNSPNKSLIEENSFRTLKDVSDTNLSCMSISDTEHQSSADESNTSEPIKQPRQPRKQVFTPVAQSDIEIIFPSTAAVKDKSVVGRPLKKYKIFSAKQAQLEADEKLLQEKQLEAEKNVAHSKTTTEKTPHQDIKSETTENISIISSKDTSLDNNNDSPTPVKRKRGRPKKNLSASMDSSSLSSVSLDGSIVNKIMEIDRKRLSPQLRKLAPSRPDKMTERSKSLSPFGKINESIVCPICFKTFRTENVLLKHVKHCTGSFDKELLQSPKKRKSSEGSQRNVSKTKDKNTSQKMHASSIESPTKKSRLEEKDSHDDKINKNSSSFSKKTKVLYSLLPTSNKTKDVATEPVQKKAEIIETSTCSKDKVKDDQHSFINSNVQSSRYVSSIPEQIIATKNKSENTSSESKSDSPKKHDSSSEDTICINPKKLMLQKSIIESEARENRAAQIAIQNAQNDKPAIDKAVEKNPTKDAVKKITSDKVKPNTINKKLTYSQKPTASPMSRLAKILNTKPPQNTNISCEICGKTFRQLAHMVYHRNKHSIDDRSAIEKTKKSEVLPKSSVVNELKDSEEISILKCEICQKGFRKLHHLVEHREVHLTAETKSRRASTASVKSEPEAGFRCDTCEKSFRKLHHLVEHRELHLAEVNDNTAKPVKEVKDETSDTTCSGCGKSFRKRHHMIEHRDIHCSPSKKSKSNDTDQSEDFNVRLSVGSTTSDESNNCGICGKSYRKLHHMVEHRESHNEASRSQTESEVMKTKDIIHECAKCYMVFPNENSLNKHSNICAKRKSLSQRRTRAGNSQSQNDISRRLDFEKSATSNKTPSIKSNCEVDDDVIIVNDNTSSESTLQPPNSKSDNPEQDKPIPANTKKETIKDNKNTNAPKEKPKLELATEKPKRRLSQPVRSKAALPVSANIRGRRSEPSLPILKPISKALQTITEDSCIRYSFPKSPKLKERSSASKDKSVNEKDKPIVAKEKSEKTDSKVAVSENTLKKNSNILEKRKAGRLNLKGNSTNTNIKSTKPAILPSSRQVIKRKSVNKPVSVVAKRRSLGGRKSIDGRKLPTAVKKELTTSKTVKSQTAIKPKKNLKENHKCDCGKTFENEVLLKRHIDSEHTPPKSFHCSICGSSLRTLSQYTKHKQEHVKEQSKKTSQSTTSIARKVKEVAQKKSTLKASAGSSKGTASKTQNPPASVKKVVKKKAAHSGVPLSDKMKRAIAGAKF